MIVRISPVIAGLAVPLAIAAAARAAPASDDLAAAQRGFAVYSQVCSSCHALRDVTFADLAGLGLDRTEIRALAASHTVIAGTDPAGRPNRRAALPTDLLPPPAYVPPPGQAAPPDLSRIALVIPGGAPAIARILSGYAAAPPGTTLPPGAFYDVAMPGHLIAMPPPLAPGIVTLADGTRPDPAQLARDAAAFLDWAAHPNRDARRRVGIAVVLYLSVLSILLFLLKRRVWSHVHR